MLGSESIDDIPEPENDDPKEVFAFFGLASYAAQVLEAELTNLLVATHLREEIPATSEAVEELFSEHFTYTLGKLLRLARARVVLPQSTDALISDALAARNRLIHRFFGDHSENFMSAAGRRDMLSELREMVVLFRRADEASSPISEALYSSLGVTSEFIDKQLEATMARARERDRERAI